MICAQNREVSRMNATVQRAERNKLAKPCGRQHWRIAATVSLL